MYKSKRYKSKRRHAKTRRTKRHRGGVGKLPFKQITSMVDRHVNFPKHVGKTFNTQENPDLHHKVISYHPEGSENEMYLTGEKYPVYYMKHTSKKGQHPDSEGYMESRIVHNAINKKFLKALDENKEDA